MWRPYLLYVVALKFVVFKIENGEGEVSVWDETKRYLRAVFFSPPFFWNVSIFIQWKSESDSVQGGMNEGVPHRCACICVCYEKEVYTSEKDIYVDSYDFRIYNRNRESCCR